MVAEVTQQNWDLNPRSASNAHALFLSQYHLFVSIYSKSLSFLSILSESEVNSNKQPLSSTLNLYSSAPEILCSALPFLQTGSGLS